MLITIIIFIITLLVLVVIHEFGHFILAKKFNVRVEEFGFGIPPRIWGKKVGETLVSINWLPFGGFVRLLGEDETNNLSSDRDFRAKNVWQRMVIVVAGVVMNFLLAAFLFYIVLSFQGFKSQFVYITPYNFFGVNQTIESFVLVRDLAKDSPADKAGIKENDIVVSLNGTKVEKDLSDMLQDCKVGDDIDLTVLRKDKEVKLTAKLEERKSA